MPLTEKQEDFDVDNRMAEGWICSFFLFLNIFKEEECVLNIFLKRVVDVIAILTLIKIVTAKYIIEDDGKRIMKQLVLLVQTVALYVNTV